jgi:hypothetical protein
MRRRKFSKEKPFIKTKFSDDTRYCYYYLVTNLLDPRRQYVGSRLVDGNHPFQDKYMGSSIYLKEDIKKYGLKNFQKEILKQEVWINNETLVNHESEFILKYDTLNPHGYNRYLPNRYPGFSMAGTHLSDEQKQRLREVNLGKKQSEESRQKRRAFCQTPKGKENMMKATNASRTPEARQKVREANLGKKLSDDTKRKIGEGLLGRKQSNEHRRKTRERMIAYCQTEEGMEQMLKANKAAHTPEADQKRGKTLKN